MTALRSILWIGDAAGLEKSPLPQSPQIDLAWVPSLDDALTLPLASFDHVVVDASVDGAETAVSDLAANRARDVLVTGEPDRFPNPADLAEATADGDPIAHSEAMRRALALASRAARSQATVLLTGETGTGKEVLARTIHQRSRRGSEPFVAANCAAFPDTLLESELFGHQKGAFTGADRTREGLFAAACGGTLFLDEVGETSGPFQAKLLRVLQEREVRPVGASRPRRVDVRIIAATHRDLRVEVANGHFREDLYYRLAVLPIVVPPLRERREDVLPLARHFLRLHGDRERKRDCTLAPDAERLLLSHAWPGNVRELENEMQRALALSASRDTIPADRLTPRLGLSDPAFPEGPPDDEPLRETLARFETWLLRRALARNDGRRTRTAQQLGITREGLWKKMKRLGIE